MLDDCPCYEFSRGLDDELRSALQGCATRDAIRRVHLLSGSSQLLNSIIFSIVTKGEGTRLNSVESFALHNYGGSIVDVSLFFSRYRLPKLKCLHLHGCRVSPWNLVGLQPTNLTSLSLVTSELLPTQALTQLLGILSFNSLLQDLLLSLTWALHIVDSETSSPVPLPHLRKLNLSDDSFHAFELLNQLEFPDKMDSIDLALHGCSPADV